MTQDLNRIEIDLQRMSEGWTIASGYPIQMPRDYPLVPNLDPEAHLMRFSVMPRETIAPLGGKLCNPGHLHLPCTRLGRGSVFCATRSGLSAL
ncbi:hypothetical protein [Rhizobium gallicum]|uniref:hypothetical protein n=1 Tax=Rhizobium gallicum TaxID=56730 RepID=UPI001EF79BC6|nr:hypothetical protein [Rhizobium gallicum]ULJ71899.1 hypothetical protein L2W42_19270 [Rhizobium gallicum]